MAFEPNTSIYIGVVPFNPDYRHVRHFPDRESQFNYFSSVCPQELRADDYTYQRIADGERVYVQKNAEQLYGYNYCMYRNTNYGSRWFYAFITEVEYINPGATALHLQLDIMQTWFPDCTVKPCMVEREHVNDDAIGAHIRDEGIDPGEMVCTYTDYDFGENMWTVVASAAEPLTNGTYVNNNGDNYLDVASGVSLSAFDLDTEFGEFKAFIKGLADNGQQDAISAIYMVPATTFPGISAKPDGYGEWVDASAPVRQDVLTWTLGFNTLDGYTPKNNKMYCYPFEYAEVSNLAGDNQQLRLEFFNTAGTVSLKRTGGVDVNARTLYIPQGYNGMADFYEGAVALPPYPTCNWVYQAWNNMLGQSRYSVNVVEDFNGNPVMQSQGDMYTLAEFNNMLGNLANFELGGFANIGGLVQDQYNTLATISQKQRTPNTSRGGTNSSVTQVNIGAYGIAVRKYTCRAEIAEQIDDFFSMYGYLVSVIKTPNITGRNSWNYVKTNGASVTGKAPAPVLKQMNALFDRGLTFWHTNDIGNYSLNNGIAG